MSGARREDYWEEARWEDVTERPDWETRRHQRLAIEFYGGLTAAVLVENQPTDPNDDTPEDSPSLATCERSPTPVASGGTAADAPVQELREIERQALPFVFRLGVQDVDRAVSIVGGGGDRLTAIYEVMGREDERKEKVLALLEADEVSHAVRLATCGQRSVQLECPEMAGGCGCDDNYVPIHCSSRLCPDCMNRNIGSIIEEWKPAIQGMSHPSFGTFTIKNVDDPAKGRDAIVGAFGRLRRRTIPFAGATEREGETKRWCWWRGTRPEDFEDGAEQWKVGLQQSGAHDLVRRLQREYVNYEWEDVTGRHRGRSIPFEEVVSGGLYAVDVKQKGPEEYNVHLHVVMDAPYVPQAALSSVWEDLTGDPVVDVRRIYDRSGDGIEKALAETVGYACKAPEFETVQDEVEFVTEMKGKALVHPFGTLHGAAADTAGLLLCSRCEQAPRWWTYQGLVDDALDNMGKNWDVAGDRPPPE